MNTNEFLASVKVASPCPARWADMAGDDRVRHCSQCQKHVYDFSAMTADEIARVVRERGGKLCARFYRRADGTMLTADCPRGAGRFRRAFQRRFAAATGLLAVSASAAVALRTASPTPRMPTRLTTLWDDTKLKVQAWLGYTPRQQSPLQHTMGRICVVPTVPPPTVPSPQQSSTPKLPNS